MAPAPTEESVTNTSSRSPANDQVGAMRADVPRVQADADDLGVRKAHRRDGDEIELSPGTADEFRHHLALRRCLVRDFL